MNKKQILIGIGALFFVIGVSVAAGWWFLVKFPRNPVSPAAYLPSETVFYAEVPNGTKTALRYQTSKLKQIVASDEYQSLFGLALSQLASKTNEEDKAALALTHWEKAGSECVQAMGGTSFFAVTHLDFTPGKDASPAATAQNTAKSLGAVAGFQRSPDGGQHVEAMVTEIEAALGNTFSDHVSNGTAVHGAIPYTWFESKDPANAGIRLCRAHWKQWDLLSIGEQPLFDFLDRAAAGNTQGSLKASPDYAAVSAKLDPDPDFVAYYNMGLVLDQEKKLIANGPQGAAMGRMVDKMKWTNGCGFDVCIKNGEIFHRCAAFVPKQGKESFALFDLYKPIPFDSTRFTSPTTVFYGAEGIDFEGFYNFYKELMTHVMATVPQNGTTDANGKPTPASPQFDMFGMMEGAVKAQGLDLHENFLRAVGPETALIVDWPEKQDVPDVILTLSVKDKEKFQPFYDKYTAMLSPMLPMLGALEKFNTGEFHALSVAPKEGPQISPTLFIGPSYWGFSLTASGAKRLLAGDHPLTAQAMEGSLAGKGEGFLLGYIKTGELLRHGYAVGKPALTTYLAGLPQDNPFAPYASKLPEELKVAPLLGETRMVARRDGDFMVSEMEASDGGTGLLAGAWAGLMAMAAQQEKAKATPPAQAPAPSVPAAPAAPAPTPAGTAAPKATSDLPPSVQAAGGAPAN